MLTGNGSVDFDKLLEEGTSPYLIKGSGLTRERYWELESDWSVRFTEEECAEGWHWCDDWDGLLVHPSMSEAASCFCFKEEK